MTTYSYNLALDDSEAIMLKEALTQMIKQCDEQLKDGPVAPFWAHKNSAMAVLRRLFADTTQTSGNDFDSRGNTIWIKQ